MDAVHPFASFRTQRLWVKVLVAVLVVLVLLVLLVVFFPWDSLRGPLNRYVSDKTGRHFEITRRLDVKVGRTTRIIADGIEFTNPEWASDPHLLKAEGAQIEIELLPLLRRHIVLPRIELHKPQLGLQMEADGRRSWALGRDTSDPQNRPDIGVLVVDQGSAHFLDSQHGADIRTDFDIHGQQPGQPVQTAPTTASSTTAINAQAMPLSFSAKGTWQKDPFTAKGRTGNVLSLSAPLQRPFPIEVDATAGSTTLHASGSVASLATLDGADAAFNLQGHDLSELYKFVGVVLPATPRFSLRGRLSKQGDVWHARQINGKLGNSDLKGELAFDRSREIPLLTGNIESASLDFDDLAPLVGLPEQPRSAAALPEVTGKRAAARQQARGSAGKVLPTASLDIDRVRKMNADVSYQAARISHVSQLPIDRISVHVRLNGGVLQLDPLKLGIASGNLAGRLNINAKKDPAVAEVHVNVRGMELNKLFPGTKNVKAGFGKIHGDIDLKGQGNSVAQMLGTSSGSLAMLMGQGEVSNLVLEIAGLDGAEIMKFLSAGDQNVLLRCGAAAFDVKNGLMTARALVFDTSDTVIYGDGQISLANEAMDLTLRPYPKDMSILSLRSPLKLTGTFAAPKPGPEKSALAGRAGAALALGAINPLLALAATVETGPGKDANCGPALREAASPYAAARIAAMSQPAAKKESSKMGAPAAGNPGKDGDAQRKRAADAKAAATDKEARQHAPAKPGEPYGK